MEKQTGSKQQGQQGQMGQMGQMGKEGQQGVISPQQVTNDDKNLINQMREKINSKLGVNHESYEIIALSSTTGGQTTQGVTRYFHLRGKPGNKEYTVTLRVPSGTGDKTQPMITESSIGLRPHREGFST